MLPGLMVGASQDNPSWDMEVENRRPFLGDLVFIQVSSLYANEDAHIEVSFNGTVVRNIWVRTAYNKSITIKWQTSLDTEPGNYKLTLIYLGVREVTRTVTLVFDPLDYAMKSIARLEREVIRLDAADDRTEGWALLAIRRVDYYLFRWVAAGFVVNVLSILTLLYLGPTAYRKFVLNAARKGLRSAADWGPNVDGHLLGQLGKETMTRTKAIKVPEPGVSKWCETCNVLVHKAEFHLHEHKEVETSEWEEFGRKAAPRKVRPLRVVKRKVVVSKSRTNPHTQEVD